MKYCNECMNYYDCHRNNWCITMDRERKYNNEYVCDNFETEHWGVFNRVKQGYQFNIDESQKIKAKDALYKRIGYRNSPNTFDIRKLPKELYKRKIINKDGSYT